MDKATKNGILNMVKLYKKKNSYPEYSRYTFWIWCKTAIVGRFAQGVENIEGGSN